MCGALNKSAKAGKKMCALKKKTALQPASNVWVSNEFYQCS